MAETPDKAELEQLLSSYIDGQCSDADRRRVEQALRHDPALRALHRQLAQTVETVRAVGGEPAPSHLRDRILTQLERRALLDQPPARHRVLRWKPWLAVAAAAMLTAAAGAGWWFYTSKPGPAPSRMMAEADTNQAARERVAPPSPAPTATDARPVDEGFSPARDRHAGRNIARPQRAKAHKPSVEAAPSADAVAPPSPAKDNAPLAGLPADASVERLQAAHREGRRTFGQLPDTEPGRRAVVQAQDSPGNAASELLAARAGEAAERAAMAAPADAVGDAHDVLACEPLAAPASQPAMALGFFPPREPAIVELASVLPPAMPSPALEMQVLVVEESDRLYVVGAVQRIVQRMAGQPVQVAIGSDRTTILAEVPRDRQFLLADQVGAMREVAGVEIRQLAADLTSLEVASAVTHPQAWWTAGHPFPLTLPRGVSSPSDSVLGTSWAQGEDTAGASADALVARRGHLVADRMRAADATYRLEARQAGRPGAPPAAPAASLPAENPATAGLRVSPASVPAQPEVSAPVEESQPQTAVPATEPATGSLPVRIVVRIASASRPASSPRP